MNFKKIKLVNKLSFFFVFLILLSNIALASPLDWRIYETTDFTVYFPKGFEYQAQETLFYLNQQNDYIKKLTGNKNNYKAVIVLQDVGLEANGSSDFINNKITL